MSGVLEQLFRPLLKGPLRTDATSSATQFAGVTTLNSGSATVTVSTNLVAADSLILFSSRAHVDQTSGSITRGIEVKTINPGNHFILGTDDGIAEIRNVFISWQIIKAS